MITVGITGRSGCGKSTVTACFAARGGAGGRRRPDLPAGAAARQPGAGAAGRPLWGRHFERGGRFGPAAAGRPGLCHPEGKADLDAITHPAIVRRIEAARQAAQAAGSPLFVIDGAVLVGSVIDGIWDRLIVVTAPYEVSVARIVARDGIRPEMARRRLDAQLPEAALAARADFLLANDGTQEQLRRQAGALAARLLAEGERGTDCPV